MSSAGRAAQAPVEKTFDTTGAPRITVHNSGGQVVVKGWDRPQVHVICKLLSPGAKLEVEQVPATGQAERVRLTTQLLPPTATGQQKTADLTVEVPLSASVDVRDPEGSVLINRVSGDASVDTASGSISVMEVAEHLTVRSISGDILIVRPSGRVEASSISGSLHFLFPTSLRVMGNTTSGNILYEGNLTPQGEYKFTNYSGNTDLVVSATASFELRARSVCGKVQSDFPLSGKHKMGHDIRGANSLVGTHRMGDATMVVASY